MGHNFTTLGKLFEVKACTGKLQIFITPIKPVFDNIQIHPGDFIWGNQAITVYNAGNLELRYWIFAAWSPVKPTTQEEAFLAASKLQIEIIKAGIPPVTLFKNSLLQLRGKPPEGLFLEPSKTERLYFHLSLPLQKSSCQFSAQLKTDFLFVAESVAG